MNTSQAGNQNFTAMFHQFRVQRGLMFGVLIITALLAFEVFNYSTTDFALTDLLGNLRFAGVRWATILAIAFCGIDFAGIARLFTPQTGNDETSEVWYLFGAWMLAATMNAMLTWWGVSIALLNHESLGNAVVERTTLVRVVPIFVAIMVWLIRVMIIGTFSIAGERLFSQVGIQALPAPSGRPLPVRSLGSGRPTTVIRPAPTATANNAAFRPSPKSAAIPEASFNRPEPTYHPASMGPHNSNQSVRK